MSGLLISLLIVPPNKFFLKSALKSRFDGGDDTRGSFEGGNNVDRKRGHD